MIKGITLNNRFKVQTIYKLIKRTRKFLKGKHIRLFHFFREQLKQSGIQINVPLTNLKKYVLILNKKTDVHEKALVYEIECQLCPAIQQHNTYVGCRTD